MMRRVSPEARIFATFEQVLANRLHELQGDAHSSINRPRKGGCLGLRLPGSPSSQTPLGDRTAQRQRAQRDREPTV